MKTAPPTVLVVHDRYQQFGGEDVAVDADIALLQAHGHRVVFHERHNDDLKSAGIMGQAQAAIGAVWSVPAARELGRLVDAVRPDVVHVHNTFPLLSPSVCAAAARRRVPVVQTVANYRMICADASLLRDGHPCEECVGRRVPSPGVRYGCYHDSRAQSAVVAAMQVTHRLRGTWRRDVAVFLPVSRHLLRRLVDAGTIPASKAMVRYNHVSPDPGMRSSGSDQGYMAFVGRLSVEKGVDVLLRAAALVPEVEIRIVGDGPSRGDLERMARDLGAHNVTFVGQLSRPDVVDAIRGARCLIVTSIWEEPMGLVLIEAAALGVPVIATKVGGIPECVGPGAGSLIPPSDPQALAREIEMAAADPAGWWERGRAARSYFEQLFTADRAYETLMAAYGLVGAAGRHEAPASAGSEPATADADSTLQDTGKPSDDQDPGPHPVSENPEADRGHQGEHRQEHRQPGPKAG